MTALNLFGYLFCCSGVAVYNWQKLQGLRKAESEKSLPSTVAVLGEKS